MTLGCRTLDTLMSRLHLRHVLSLLASDVRCRTLVAFVTFVACLRAPSLSSEYCGPYSWCTLARLPARSRCRADVDVCVGKWVGFNDQCTLCVTLCVWQGMHKVVGLEVEHFSHTHSLVVSVCLFFSFSLSLSLFFFLSLCFGQVYLSWLSVCLARIHTLW